VAAEAGRPLGVFFFISLFCGLDWVRRDRPYVFLFFFLFFPSSLEFFLHFWRV